MIDLLLAAEGAEHADVMAFNWLPAATALVVFIVVLGVLYAKVWPVILKGLDDRDHKIRDEIRAAEEARMKAKAALTEYEQNLTRAREEAHRMISQAKSDAKAAGEELRRRNEAELGEMKQRASREIESAKQSAISDLHAEAATLASAIAGKILEREISVEDQQRLVEESLRELTKVQHN